MIAIVLAFQKTQQLTASCGSSNLSSTYTEELHGILFTNCVVHGNP